jgi:hypothetical protein
VTGAPLYVTVAVTGAIARRAPPLPEQPHTARPATHNPTAIQRGIEILTSIDVVPLTMNGMTNRASGTQDTSSGGNRIEANS